MIPGFEDTLKNAIPPAAPGSAGGVPDAVDFRGISRPSSDMAAVRDGRRATPQGYLVDLSAARSIAAGTALALPLQGNVFISDPLYDLTGNALAGIARVHFQDVSTNPSAVGTFVTVLPTSIYRVPFTQVLIENYAQAGKSLYIVYGTDVDVVPGGSQQVQASVLSTVAPSGVAQVHNAVVVTNASAQLMAANAGRKYVAIQVDTAQPAGIRIRVDGGAAADAGGSLEIKPGQTWVPLLPPIGQINAIRQGGVNITVTTIEG